MPRRERDRVRNVFSVGDRGTRHNLGANEVTLDEVQADVALELIDGVLAICVDHDLDSVDSLHCSWVPNVSDSEVDLLRTLSNGSRDVVFGQEGLDKESLLETVTFLFDPLC